MNTHLFEATRIPVTCSVAGMQSVLRVLIHARNSHGALRGWIRATIRADLARLRELSHGGDA